jgi:dTDP-4-dehydrorhamnose reductase
LAEAEPEPVFRVNAGGAGNLARAALEIRAAIIHVSTDYVFSGDSSAPYVESDPAEPVNVYGRSKLAGEAAVREANPRSIVARSAWLFSPWGSNFLKTMLELGRERDELSIVGDQHGSPTNAQDLALALLRIAATIHRSPVDDPVWGIYHVANSGAASRFEQATAIFAAASQFGMRQPRLTSIASREYPAPARRPRYAVLNNEKFSTKFAMQMRDWREATRECVELLLQPG